MSNFTAKKRAGGGSTTSPVLNTMLFFETYGGVLVQIYTAYPPNVSTLNPSDFTALPGGQTGVLIHDVSSDGFYVDFSGDVAATPSIGFQGNGGYWVSPNILAPA